MPSTKVNHGPYVGGLCIGYPKVFKGRNHDLTNVPSVGQRSVVKDLYERNNVPLYIKECARWIVS